MKRNTKPFFPTEKQAKVYMELRKAGASTKSANKFIQTRVNKRGGILRKKR